MIYVMENPMRKEVKRRRETIRRKRRKERIKYRRKLKEKKAFQKKELEEEREASLSNNEIKFKKMLPDKPKEELSKRSIRKVASKFDELILMKRRDQKSRARSSIDEETKNLIQFTEESDLESDNIESFNSFKTMSRMLSQSSLVICSQSTAVVEIS
jgi:hypothetical protein